MIKSAGKEAEGLSGGAKFLSHSVGANILGGTVAGVGTYQINSHIAKKQGQAPPPLSATTGGMPNNAPAVSDAITQTTKKVTKRRKKNVN